MTQMNKRFTILCWNVRGLNEIGKRNTVRNFICSVKPDIICFQEMKLPELDDRMLKQVLGGRYKERVHVEAIGSAGGLLIAWKQTSFAALAMEKQRNIATVDLKFKMDGTVVRITGAYGPSNGSSKDEFLQ
jgi:exonuclease III